MVRTGMEATAYVFLLSKRTIPWINCGSSACIIRCKEKNDSVLFPHRSGPSFSKG